MGDKWTKRQGKFLAFLGQGERVTKAARDAGFPACVAASANDKILFPLIRLKGIKALRRLEAAGMPKLECLRLFAKAVGYPVPPSGGAMEDALRERGLDETALATAIVDNITAERTKIFRNRDGSIHKETLEDNEMRRHMINIAVEIMRGFPPQRVDIRGGVIHGHVELPADFVTRLREDLNTYTPLEVEDAEYVAIPQKGED